MVVVMMMMMMTVMMMVVVVMMMTKLSTMIMIVIRYIVDNFVVIFLLLWGMGVRQNMQTFLVCKSCIWGYFAFFFNVLSGSESIESHSQKGYETITEDFFRE